MFPFHDVTMTVDFRYNMDQYNAALNQTIGIGKPHIRP